jgi:hypothetical protein
VIGLLQKDSSSLVKKTKSYLNNITREEIDLLEVHQFSGRIHIIDQEEDVAAAVDILRKHSVIGFDTETKPNFKKGSSNRVALLQLAISEDISDIYQDIRDFLEVFRNSPEEIMNDALWECKTLFENNWGDKLLRVSRAMHLIYVMDDSGFAPSDQKSIEEGSPKKIDTRDWFITKRQQQFGEEDEIIPE